MHNGEAVKALYGEIQACRLCGSGELKDILDLGSQSYTGRFIKSGEDNPPYERLAISRCEDCGLVQLKDTYPDTEMYGDTYGYRSSITDTMRQHLKGVGEYAVSNSRKDLALRVLDIGSNDGTLLNVFDDGKNILVGIDPCASKYIDNYPEKAQVVSDFFSAENLRKNDAPLAFDIVTSIAMFYDLNDPTSFARNIHSVLDDDGIWITEQTHSHTLIESNAYDSICHEHATYLSLRAMEEICRDVGFRILDISTNNINGGSFRTTIAKVGSSHSVNEDAIQRFRDKENSLFLDRSEVWEEFNTRVYRHRDELRAKISDYVENGLTVFGYGASTKGNVILQFCNISPELMPVILERDANKFGLLTPGTQIPIVSEEEGRGMRPDVLVVFPWHFKSEIIKRENDFLMGGGTLLFPLPEIEIVTKDSQGC